MIRKDALNDFIFFFNLPRVDLEKETKETIAKISKAKSWFFEKINKIDKPLAKSSRKKRRRINQQN